MISFPNAKINLGLQIVERLPNGYHQINSCLYPIPWSDVLEVVPSKKTSFTSTGITIPSGDDNIILKAYRLLKKDYALPEISIHLHKSIPIGAGMGGGSSDGAFTLKLLSEENQLFLDETTLESYAEELGSDCPFFIKNKPALASGTGTELETIPLDLSGMHLLVINPGIHISTKEAYDNISPKPVNMDLKELLLTKDFKLWKKSLVNDFEMSIFSKYPQLCEIKDMLYENGASYAAMSGSGSTMFGLFQEKPQNLVSDENWIVKSLIL